jgi:hypothetical protein
LIIGKCWFVEDGLLGFKTLTLIRHSQTGKIQNGIDLDPDAFPIDDKRRMSFSTGETVDFSV